jgi:hypothetical protein
MWLEGENGYDCCGGIYLGTAGRVLCPSSSNELCVAVLEEVFVETHVLLFGENSIIGLHAVLLEHGIVTEVGLGPFHPTRWD